MEHFVDASLTSPEALQLAEAHMPEGQLPSSPNVLRILDGMWVMAKLVDLLVSVLTKSTALLCLTVYCEMSASPFRQALVRQSIVPT